MPNSPTGDTERTSAAHAGLRYVADAALTIQRIRHGKSFVYSFGKNRWLRNKRTLLRIQKIVIPPAWTEVRICPDPRGHLQAVGRDAKGRKQYRYHARWSKIRNENKFNRLADFGRALPRIRREIARQLRRPGLSRTKVLAAVIRLLELSAIRVGNEEYAARNGSYGLTTLRNRHAMVRGATINLRFRGKSGKEHDLSVENPALAHIVRKCQHLPGQKLFEYVDETGVHPVRSEDVNSYLAEISGSNFTAKDFRTWSATASATLILSQAVRHRLRRKNEQTIIAMIKEVAQTLGNTPAICRKSYIHPAITAAYLSGTLSQVCSGSANAGLSRAETRLLRLLKGLQ